MNGVATMFGRFSVTVINISRRQISIVWLTGRKLAAGLLQVLRLRQFQPETIPHSDRVPGWRTSTRKTSCDSEARILRCLDNTVLQ